MSARPRAAQPLPVPASLNSLPVPASLTVCPSPRRFNVCPACSTVGEAWVRLAQFACDVERMEDLCAGKGGEG